MAFLFLNMVKYITYPTVSLAWFFPMRQSKPNPIAHQPTTTPHVTSLKHNNKNSLAAMRVACEYQAQQETRRTQLHQLVRTFQSHLQDLKSSSSAGLLPSPTPIQAVLVPGNERCTRVATALQESGLDVRPLRPPTVPAGKERLRVVLHWHNKEAEVRRLAGRLKELLLVDEEGEGKGAVGGGGGRGGVSSKVHRHPSPSVPAAAAAAVCAAADAPAAVSRL